MDHETTWTRLLKVKLGFLFWSMTLAGCAASSQHVVLSLQDISCASCGAHSVETIRGAKGVQRVQFHKTKAEISIRYETAKQTPDTLRDLVTGLGYGGAESAPWAFFYGPLWASLSLSGAP